MIGLIFGFYSIFAITVLSDQAQTGDEFCKPVIGARHSLKCQSKGFLLGMGGLAVALITAFEVYFYMCLSVYAEQDRFYSTASQKQEFYDAPD